MGLFGGFNIIEGATGTAGAFPPWQADNVNGEIYVGCAEAYYDFSVTESISGFGNVVGNNKTLGGVLAPNGNIYLIPNQFATVFKIDTTADTVTSLGSAGGRWSGGVLAPNGKIYCPPYYTTTSILEIDPSTDTFTTFGSVTQPAGGNGWFGAVLANNGLIYCIPNNSADVLIIDPDDQSVSTFSTAYTGTDKWVGGVLGPNGKIYCAPHDATTVLVIDPSDNTTSTIDVSTIYVGNNKWAGAVLAPNGSIYMIPYISTKVLKIDPSNDTASSFGSHSGGGNNFTGCLGPNGKIYSPPSGANTSVLVIDPATDTISTFGTFSSGGQTGCVLALNGSIYGSFGTSTEIAKILDEQPSLLDEKGPLSRYQNKL